MKRDDKVNGKQSERKGQEKKCIEKKKQGIQSNERNETFCLADWAHTIAVRGGP